MASLSAARVWLFAALAFGFMAAAAPAAHAQQAISLGQNAQGTLAPGDSQLSQGEYADTYAFQGRAGQTFTVRMNSSAFDSYLIITGPNGFAQQNDDEASPNTDAGLTVTLPRDGVYTIVATSLYGKETGAYVLQVIGGGAAQQSAESAGGAIAIGQSVRARLENGDQQLSSGEFADAFTVSGQSGQTLIFEMTSTEFDPYLIVRGPGGLSEDNDDNGDQGSRDSRVRVTLPASGEITIRPTSYSAGETGAYTLSVREEGASQAQASVASSGSVRLGQSVSGTLQTGDALADSGEFRDAYTLNGRRGQQIEVRLQSGAFDPYVAIFGPGDFSEFNDDDAENGTLNSRMLVTLPADGAYTIMATSYGAGQGAYTLSVAESDSVDPGQGVASNADTLRIGRAVNATLASGDDTLRSGEFTDTYRFQAQAGDRIRIDMSSQALDSYVILVAPSGAQEENDDGPAGVGDSVLETQLTESGEYAVIATSYSAGETGAYSLRVSPLGASASAPARPGASGGGGRVFAVMVGIADYHGFANNLQYTDEDAVKMGQALQRAGVLADQSIVLTNAQATIAGVRAAFQRVAAQAGPNDTFLFFYSGHGTQTPASTSASEPDGKDESIVMVDGLISDDDMAALFRQVHAGTSIIALDACFSGGFARDVVAIPGVMGLFSSEEDLTSAVADKFQAGGYLSLFLRNGLGGEADSDHNSVLTAGELSVYLRREFAANAQDVESSTMEGQRNYQFLVVDRGGVGIDSQILRLGS